MALYATPPSTRMVGPKIGRSEYGGFLMTYPPGRMFHVFEDPYFDDADTKAERLLYAAIDYCNERSIVYVAAKPPRPKLMRFGPPSRASRSFTCPSVSSHRRRCARFGSSMCSTGAPVRSYADKYVRSLPKVGVLPTRNSDISRLPRARPNGGTR